MQITLAIWPENPLKVKRYQRTDSVTYRVEYTRLKMRNLEFTRLVHQSAVRLISLPVTFTIIWLYFSVAL
jgi:hypothetical protein